MDFKQQIETVLSLAWRNVWKNKRRTILTLTTVAVGCMVIIFMNAIGKGGHDEMIEDAVSVHAGHIQIHEKGFQENQSLEYALEPAEKIVSLLNNDERVEAWTKRVHAGGLLSFEGSTAGAIIVAVEPDREAKVTDIHTKILDGGSFLEKGDGEKIVVGEVLAKNLGLSVGDSLDMISQGFDGSTAVGTFTVKGIFHSGNPEYDRSMIMMPLVQAEYTFTMMGYVSSIVIRVKETSDIFDVRDKIRGAVDTKKLEVMAWNELMPDLVQWIEMDDASLYIFDFILFLVVAFGILNTIQMSVYERIREFGIMLAIGTRPGQVTAIVMAETVFIAILGIIIGVSLGSALSMYFHYYPINIEQYAAEAKAFKMNVTQFPADLTWVNITVTSMVTFLLAMVFTLIPARKAASLNPVDAIRHL